MAHTLLSNGGIIYFILCFQICSPSAENPKIEKRLTRYNLEKALNVFANTLRTVSIPNYSGKSGKWSYGVSNMKITSFDTPKVNLNWHQGSISAGLTANIGHVAMKGDWRFSYRSWWPLRFSDRGRFRLQFNGIRFSIAASLRRANNVHKVSVTTCRCRVSSSRIRLRGGGSWLYRLWNRTIERKITKAVNGKVCDVNCRKIKSKHITI